MAFTPQERTSLITIASLYLIRMLGLFMVLPVLSLYGAELSQATPLLLGLALGIYGLTQAALQIPFGWCSDRLGRKPVLIFGFVLFILGSLICAQADSIGLLILGRALQGAGAVSAVLLALVADQISVPNRTVSMAIIGVSIGLSFGLSIVLGPLVASYFSGLAGIFYLSSLLGVLALFLVFVSFPQSGNMQAINKKKRGSSLGAVFTPNLLRMDFSIFVLHFMQMCIWVAVPGILVQGLGIPLEDHWLIYMSVVGGGFILMAPFMRFWDKRGQTKTAILAAVAVCTISLLLMQQFTSYAFFIFGLFLFFWGFNLLEATLPSTLTKLADTENKGTASGVYSTCQFLGVFLGGVTGGWLIQSVSPSAVFMVSAMLALVWWLLMLPAKNLGHLND